MSFDLSDLGAQRIDNQTSVQGGFDLSDLGGSLASQNKKKDVKRLPSKMTEDQAQQKINDVNQSMYKHGAKALRNVAAGAGDVLDPLVYLANHTLGAVGLKHENPQTLGNAIGKGIDYISGGYTSPETEGDRTSESIGRMAGSILSGAGAGSKLAGIAAKKAFPTMAEKAVSKAGRGLSKINPINPTNIAASSAGAGAGHSYSERNKDDTLGTIGTGLGTDLAVRTLLGANPRNMASMLKINPKNFEAFREMGIEPTLGQVSDRALIKNSEKFLENVGLSGKIRGAREKQYNRMSEILGPGATGNALTEKQAGNVAKKGMSEYKTKAGKVTQRLKEKYLKEVEKANTKNGVNVNPETLIPTVDAFVFGNKIRKDLGEGSASKLFTGSPLGKQFDLLEEMMVENKGKIPLDHIEKFRRQLKNEASKLEVGSVAKGELDTLRDHLNKDINKYMEDTIGNTRAWKNYNKFYTKYAQNRKEHLNISKETLENRADEIFDSILKGKIDRPFLETTYASLKKPQQKEFLDSIIQKMGKNGDKFNVHSFAKKFSELKDETQDVLLRPLSEKARQEFKAVIKGVDINKDLANFGNPSRTAYTQNIVNTGKATALGTAALISGTGSASAVWPIALGIAAEAGAEKAFTSPRFLKWAEKGAKLNSVKDIESHIKGLKGILGRPAYQQVKNAISEDLRSKDKPEKNRKKYAAGGDVEAEMAKALSEPKKKPPYQFNYDHKVFKYLESIFYNKHLRDISSAEAKNAFQDAVSEKAIKRATARFPPPANTMIGFNQPVLDDLYDFIKDPKTQNIFRDVKGVAVYNIPHHIPGIEAKAYQVGPGGTTSFEGPGSFDTFSFSSKGSRHAKKPSYGIPDHFEGVGPKGYAYNLAKRKTFS